MKSFTSLPSVPDFEWLSSFTANDAGGNRAGAFSLGVITTLTQYTPTTTLDATLTIKNTQSSDPDGTKLTYSFKITLRDECLDQVLTETTPAGPAAGVKYVVRTTPVAVTYPGPGIAGTISLTNCPVQYEL